MQQELEVKFKKLSKEAVLPTYAHDGDAGLDLTCIDYKYDSGTNCFIYKTGLAVEIPKGYVMLLSCRSSNRNTDYYMPDEIPVIDSTYRGEITICFKNRDATPISYKPPYFIGNRICQAIIIPYPKIICKFVEELSKTERGENGYGSTGW